MENRRTAFAKERRLPDATPAHPDIIINELQYNPGGGYEVEFVELYNPNDFAVDMSGWKLEGVDLTFQHGTVITADSFLVATKNDRDFKAEHTGNIFVADQYNGKLSNGGELIELLDSTGYVIDEVEYSDGDDNEDENSWPSEADGSGYSLSLRATNLDNSLPDNWVVSTGIGGTPGRANNSFVESKVLSLTVQYSIVSLPITSFSNQDQGPGQASVDESGFALSLSGNVWKRALFDYTITPNTILEFDFQGTQEGEAHSIGFETNNSASSSLVF